MWLILCLTLLFSAPGTQSAEQVELFDTDKQQVVATFPNNEVFQKEAEQFLGAVSGRVLEYNPSLDHAMIVKIPLAPPKRLTHRPSQLDVDIADMFVVMPKKGSRAPWLILHTKQYETVIVEFAGTVDKLRSQVKLP